MNTKNYRKEVRKIESLSDLRFEKYKMEFYIEHVEQNIAQDLRDLKKTASAPNLLNLALKEILPSTKSSPSPISPLSEAISQYSYVSKGSKAVLHQLLPQHKAGWVKKALPFVLGLLVSSLSLYKGNSSNGES